MVEAISSLPISYLGIFYVAGCTSSKLSVLAETRPWPLLVATGLAGPSVGPWTGLSDAGGSQGGLAAGGVGGPVNGLTASSRLRRPGLVCLNTYLRASSYINIVKTVRATCR